MCVHEVMTEGVQSIPPTSAAEGAWNVMHLNRIQHMVVTKAGCEAARLGAWSLWGPAAPLAS